MENYLYPLALLCLAACTEIREADPNLDPIRINQIGYFSHQTKSATIEDEGTSETYRLLDATTREPVWESEETRTCQSPWNGKKRHIVDFSSVTTPGTYLLQSGPYHKQVVILEHPLRELVIASMKAFYFQRTAEPIKWEYAGQWERPAAHLDTCVLVHGSAASKERPEGTILSSAGGWYDAGDYNKYIVNSAFTIGEILTVYEMNPAYFNSIVLEIPESSNTTPDVLDELMVNLKWMLTMQDPHDGGVYHKLTSPNFEAFQMPQECSQPRYVVQKSTPATLDFAAVMALASRVYAPFEEYQDFCKQARNAALEAWKWARKYPKKGYQQEEINKSFSPTIHTGEYGDGEFRDELFWAASQLYFSTGQRTYLNTAVSSAPKEGYSLPTWGQVDGLAIMEWLVQTTYGFSQETELLGNRFTRRLIEHCDHLLTTISSSCYDSPFGNSPKDFGWGCLAESCCGEGLSLLFAYRMTSEDKYLNAAIQCADYLLGRNATGYCYVTGFGLKPAMHPHHRISEADSIEWPIPGLLVGGPNPGQQDRCEGYPSSDPDESYIDRTESYASNEIAINWNAGLFSLIGWLDSLGQ